MDIKSEILHYIEQEELCGALLLTGKWGSGKTYLLREIAEEVNGGKEKLIVFVSLFGVSSVEELNKKVKEVVVSCALGLEDSETKELSKLAKLAKHLLGVAGNIDPEAKVLNGVLSINPYDFMNITDEAPFSKRKLVFVFDDFERATIAIKEGIGAINEYVENKGIHTIIVADEEKIEGEDYQEFKEKVIGKTISLSPDTAQIIPAIIEAYHEEKTENGYKEFLKKNLNTIRFVFVESGLNNIRSLKAALVEFERVYLLWKSQDFPMDRLSDILYSFCAAFFEYRAGNQIENMDKKYFRWGKNASHINALDMWILLGEWEEDNFLVEVNSKLFGSDISDENKFLHYSPWDLEGETIENAFPVALKKAYSGEYSADEAIAFLKKILFFKENEIDILEDYNSREFLHGWKLHEEKIKDGQIDGRESHSFMLPGEMKCADEYEYEIHDRIQQFDRMLPSWKTRQKLIVGMKHANISEYVSVTDYLNDLDDELADKIIEYFSKCTNFERRIIVSILNNIDLSRIDFAEEKDSTERNLKKFISYLEEVKNNTDDVIAQLTTATGIKLISNKLNGTYE